MSAAAEKEHTISIKPHEAEVLKELVLKYHVNTALEIGLAYGASAMTMLGARSELKLTSCDPFQQEDYQNSGLSKHPHVVKNNYAIIFNHLGSKMEVYKSSAEFMVAVNKNQIVGFAFC